jgi:hypothetical protein
LASVAARNAGCEALRNADGFAKSNHTALRIGFTAKRMASLASVAGQIKAKQSFFSFASPLLSIREAEKRFGFFGFFGQHSRPNQIKATRRRKSGEVQCGGWPYQY